MQQYNYPTIIYFGNDAIIALGEKLKSEQMNKILLVTDKTLNDLGVVKDVLKMLSASEKEFIIFDKTHPNPLEEDVELGVKAFKENNCEGIIALGGGSPMDVAKVIKIAVAHEGPLAQYDDALGGDKLIVNEMPPLYAIPTTAGTGSEVGRSGVIIMKETNKKTIFFAPELMPDIAVLDPLVTEKLPAHITAATGIDALTHCLEAYLAPGFHPMADGIALEGIALVLSELPKAYKDGSDLEAREKMLMAATMGATAFQKGLGMVHSLAHPLSSQFHMHHGLANALLLPFALKFLEDKLSEEALIRLNKIQELFKARSLEGESLSDCCRIFFESLGIKFGLKQHGIEESAIDKLTQEAFADPCHHTNIIPVLENDLAFVYKAAL
ncbi:MAG: alcohol dehydrogenase [Planctomycetota bacterium]|nr:MAG: alcohol dehydrogenase [Planctomycetota bacterium]